MGKVLVWIGVVAVAWFAWRLWGLSQRRVARARREADTGAGTGASGGDAQPAAPAGRRPDAPELMMQCAVCGVHLPGSEARFAGGRVYCSDAHRDQARTPSDAAPRERR
jgi:uncharacterized protein